MAGDDSDVFSVATGALDQSMRQMAASRKTWQKKGIVVFESIGYMMVRFLLISISLLMSQTENYLISLDNEQG